MEITKQTKIAVLCGGISSEREISLKSGKNTFNALQRLGYKNSSLLDIKTIQDILTLEKEKFETAFLVTHGKFGEDGAIQGILEWLKIPYTGSSILGSAISMDKWLTKQIAQNNNILTPEAHLINNINKSSIESNKIWEELSKRYGAVFVKPRDDGSSVNTYKIKGLQELTNTISKLDLSNSDYLIEEYIAGRELTISLIEVKGQLKFLPVLELKPKNEFYDYESKYTKGMTDFILPANLDKATLDKIKDSSLNIFSTIGCSSFGRVDYILDTKNNPYLLEINSLPGMTDTSDLPAQAAASGIEYDELVEIILMSAKLHKDKPIAKQLHIT